MSGPFRIAIPKGRLQQRVLEIFAAAGLELPESEIAGSRRLIFNSNGIEWVLVKDVDAPRYVESGAASIGVAGRDQILEQKSDVYQPLELPFGRCRLMLIGSPDAPPLVEARAIATKYPNLTRAFAEARGLHARVIPLAGSVELAPLVGIAPYIVDLVETGATIREHGLIPLETLEEIAPCLIVNRNAYRIDGERIRHIVELVEQALPKEVAV